AQVQSRKRRNCPTLEPTRVMKYRLFSIAILALLPAVGSAADPKKAPKVTYDEHVLPILRDKCVGCHNQDKKRGGLILSNYTAAMQGGSSGVAIKPGDPYNSLLFKAVSHKPEPFMPPNSPRIPDDKLAVIEKWIAGGALENSGSKTILTGKPKTDIGLTSVIRGKPEGPPPMPPATLQLE